MRTKIRDCLTLRYTFADDFSHPAFHRRGPLKQVNITPDDFVLLIFDLAPLGLQTSAAIKTRLV